MKNRVTAVVLAAGQGKRMNTPVAKQFLTLQNKPLLYYSLKAFEESSIDDIILVTGKDQMDYCMNNIIKPYQINKVSKVVEGGKERYDSVYQALMSIETSDYVLIHDGARPFITCDKIEEIIHSVAEFKACIIGTPVKETIKMVNPRGFITSTPSRNALWAAQTPQAFEFPLIKKAYDLLYADKEACRPVITDDAMVYETYLDLPVKILQGDYQNLKITTPEDMIMAEQIAKQLFPIRLFE